MKRRAFLRQTKLGLVGLTLGNMMNNSLAAGQISRSPMPVLFVGHGSPLNAIEDNEFSRAWIDVGKNLPRPQVILAISAHWESAGAQVTAMPLPRTIHDFQGFPAELFAVKYPAPGAPDAARRVRELLGPAVVALDEAWGLDHGTWSVLVRMFPKADVPVLQLSLNRQFTPAEHYALGGKLAALRREGVLVVCSGNIVHNLRLLEWGDKRFAWAEAFDLKLKGLIESRDHVALIAYSKLGPDALRAIPTAEHYLPLLYALALRGPLDPLKFFAEKVTLGSISMRSFQLG